LQTMETVVPRSDLEAQIEPYDPKTGRGRRPVDLGIMPRTYFLQPRFKLPDPGTEDAFCDSPALRGFAGIDLDLGAAAGETTILNFRHLLEAHDLCGRILDAVSLYLDSKGIRLMRIKRNRPIMKHGECSAGHTGRCFKRAPLSRRGVAGYCA